MKFDLDYSTLLVVSLRAGEPIKLLLVPSLSRSRELTNSLHWLLKIPSMTILIAGTRVTSKKEMTHLVLLPC